MQMTMSVDRRRKEDIHESNCEIDGWGNDTDIHFRYILGLSSDVFVESLHYPPKKNSECKSLLKGDLMIYQA